MSDPRSDSAAHPLPSQSSADLASATDPASAPAAQNLVAPYLPSADPALADDPISAASNLIEVQITHLQMFQLPDRPFAQPTREDLSIVRAVRPTVSFYRYLYDTVGEPWLWWMRRQMPEAELAAIVQDDHVEVHVLYTGGVPAGYVELDRRQPPEIELAYFGLIPQFIGQRLGPYLLDWAIQRAWSYQPDRFWLHTCTLDHPKALAMYQQAGFAPFKTETKWEPNPRQYFERPAN